MSVQSWRQTAVFAFSLVSLSACKQSTPPLLPSIFTNPGEVTLICFDTDSNESLPLKCCSNAPNLGDVCSGTPVAHALVTQIQRGEVAAVDLEEKKVQDSNRSIPGYTFVDVGGLPTAIVVPPSQPGIAEGEPEQGPKWAYVAGRQNNSVRAIQTCRFRVKDRALGDAVDSCDRDAESPSLDLASEPRDMVLSEDGQGLWISLPDKGLLGYVALPKAEPATGANPESYPPLPEDVVYYPLPKDLDLEPPTPVSEESLYGFFCDSRDTEADAGREPWDDVRDTLRARYADPSATPDPDAGVAPAAPLPLLRMPPSTPAASTRKARPTLLRMVEASPGQRGKLLFVVDEGQMVLHAFSYDAAESALSLRATLPVGAPVRDFAVTPSVPARALTLEQIQAGSHEETPEQKRYLYAIDDRDGSVMAFELAISQAGVPSLTPLLAAQPARDSLHNSRNLADRLSIDGYSARALEIVDTRTRLTPDGKPDNLYCGDGSRSEQDGINEDPGRSQELDLLQEEIDARKKELAALTNKPGGSKPDVTETKEREVAAAQERYDRVKNAGPRSLYGVFLMVASTTGQLVVLDVHDMDLPCRHTRQCDFDDPPDDKLGVIIERHTLRLTGTSVPTVAFSGTDELDRNVECPPGYAKVPDDESPLCVSGDPWVARGLPLSVAYEAPFSAQTNGVLEPQTEAALAALKLDEPALDAASTIMLRAPAGVDLCARGANAKDQLFASLTSAPETKAGSGCSVSLATPPHLRVIKAWHDAMLLDVSADALEDAGFPARSDVDTLLRCYPKFVAFDVGVRDQYLVRGAGYQHNTMTFADASCVVDDALDERFTAIAQLGERFRNQYVAFTLKAKETATVAGAGDAGTDAGSEEELALTQKKEVNPSMSVTINATVVSTPVAGATSRADTLPHRVRYFPETGYLFVVDQASQGLRSFELTPVLRADSSARYQ